MEVYKIHAIGKTWLGMVFQKIRNNKITKTINVMINNESIVIDDSLNLDWKKVKVYFPDDISWLDI